MVPRNVARISEYVRNMSDVPATGRSQLALSTGEPETTGTHEPWKKCSWVPALTWCLPEGQNTEPCAMSPSTTPSALSTTGSLTCNTTSICTSTVVAVENFGGSGSVSPVNPPCRALPSPTNRAHMTNVGAAMAKSLSQYWNACTIVIARIPPPTTLTTTTTATSTAPTQLGAGRIL